MERERKKELLNEKKNEKNYINLPSIKENKSCP